MQTVVGYKPQTQPVYGSGEFSVRLVESLTISYTLLPFRFRFFSLLFLQLS